MLFKIYSIYILFVVHAYLILKSCFTEFVYSNKNLTRIIKYGNYDHGIIKMVIKVGFISFVEYIC